LNNEVLITCVLYVTILRLYGLPEVLYSEKVSVHIALFSVMYVTGSVHYVLLLQSGVLVGKPEGERQLWETLALVDG
jgi:hypothetical protein